MTRSDVVPRFEDYVTARGPDLLRLAWYLCGDPSAARTLVARALGRSLARWEHLTDEGLGAYDAALRAALVHTFLSVRGDLSARVGGPARVGGLARVGGPVRVGEPVRVGRGPTAAAASPGLWSSLMALPKRDRALVMLQFAEDLPPARTADLLDTTVAAVAARTRHAVRILGTTQDSLRATLPTLVPVDPSTDGLAQQARAYAGRGRRVRRVLSSVGGVAVVALAAVVAGSAQHSTVPVPPKPPTTVAAPKLTCGMRTDPAVLTARLDHLSATAVQALVCARIDSDSVWQGSLPPDAPVKEPMALDALTLDPRTDGRGCAALPDGPAFRLLLLGPDLVVRSFANEGLACNGWPALSRYYVALAEQQASQVGAAPAGFLGCEPVLQHAGADGTLPASRPLLHPALAKGTVFVQATACLHPTASVGRVPHYRDVRSNVLGAPQLAQLNADAHARGSAPGRLPPCDDATSLVVVRAVTRSGHLFELSERCGRAASVNWSSRDVWTMSAGTAGMLRSLLVVE
ncbi:hypothetical protein [Pedococcus sp. 5OH_020]|uniref:hypothetical protein n=1 Tax=Pedococcus sp. 5OH_020 TaxID=2989814 RepID=UPI0022E9A1FB|nr:hypothetical protein [Pedococcus sp. 5OH_020]